MCGVPPYWAQHSLFFTSQPSSLLSSQIPFWPPAWSNNIIIQELGRDICSALAILISPSTVHHVGKSRFTRLVRAYRRLEPAEISVSLRLRLGVAVIKYSMRFLMFSYKITVAQLCNNTLDKTATDSLDPLSKSNYHVNCPLLHANLPNRTNYV